MLSRGVNCAMLQMPTAQLGPAQGTDGSAVAGLVGVPEVRHHRCEGAGATLGQR